MARFAQPLALCKPTHQIIVKDVRISVLSSKIVRIEKAKNGFVDNRTKAIYCRDFCDLEPKISVQNSVVEIQIAKNTFRIQLKDLSFRVFLDGKEVKVSKKQNLKGTVRTLDGNAGVCPLPDGLMSKSGLTVLDDTKSCILQEDGRITVREEGSIDFYLLAFGHDYLAGLQEFYKLSGPVPLIPKYAFGNWWSRYHAYSDTEYLALMDTFQQKEIPFTVATVDMDWHLVKNVPKDVPAHTGFSRGWTGYTFEKELFPDYKAFLNELHKRNLKVALNLHPRDGVRYYECQYEAMAKANGIDPAGKQTVEFDLLNETFRDSYFDILHHPYEKDGVDIWWIDWQQGDKSKLKGVDPLWLLNHYHYLDSNRAKRSIILSRFSGIGAQRYPLGFSGDTIVCWGSLKLQPYFTLCAANVGYTLWSHDIGGHMNNLGNNELYLRWLQLGCFLPINRLHSTNNTLSKEPWLYPSVEQEAIATLQLRHSLIAYCYSASIQNHRDGIPICAPLYYFYDEENAYKKAFRNEYMFGSALLVCPVTSPKRWRKESRIKIWLPAGNWVNIFTGKRYQGNRVLWFHCPLDVYPVFAKEGSFLPLLRCRYNEIDTQALLVKVVLGNGEYTLWDDDGSLHFQCQKEENGYMISVQKQGEFHAETIEFEFLGSQIQNRTISIQNAAHFSVEQRKIL